MNLSSPVVFFKHSFFITFPTSWMVIGTFVFSTLAYSFWGFIFFWVMNSSFFFQVYCHRGVRACNTPYNYFNPYHFQFYILSALPLFSILEPEFELQAFCLRRQPSCHCSMLYPLRLIKAESVNVNHFDWLDWKDYSIAEIRFLQNLNYSKFYLK